MCWFLLWIMYMETWIYSGCCNGGCFQWRFGGDSVYPWYEEEDLSLHAYYSNSCVKYLLGHWTFRNTCRSIYAWGMASSSFLCFHPFILDKKKDIKEILFFWTLNYQEYHKRKKVSLSDTFNDINSRMKSFQNVIFFSREGLAFQKSFRYALIRV